MTPIPVVGWTWRPVAARVILILSVIAFALALFHIAVGTLDLTVLGLLLFALAFVLA